MKKTSALVLSLLFATCNAVNLSKVDGYEAVDDGAEKVHVLDIGANTMTNNPETYPTMGFPGPLRTAFYAQTDAQFYDEENGLWRQELVQRHKADDFPTYVRPPPEGDIGEDVYDHTMDATSGIPWDRSRSKKPAFTQRRKKVDPISPEDYDPWVYKFSRDNMPPYPQWQTMDEGPDSKSTSMQWNYNYG